MTPATSPDSPAWTPAKPSLRQSLWTVPWALFLTFDDAARAYRCGYLSPAQWSAFRWAWTWAAPRFRGAAAAVQDAFQARHGLAALERRRQRVLAVLAHLSPS
jgi:hypothetical protein